MNGHIRLFTAHIYIQIKPLSKNSPLAIAKNSAKAHPSICCSLVSSKLKMRSLIFTNGRKKHSGSVGRVLLRGRRIARLTRIILVCHWARHFISYSDSFTILGLWVLGLATSNINESPLQTNESKTLFLMTSLPYYCIPGLAGTRRNKNLCAKDAGCAGNKITAANSNG